MDCLSFNDDVFINKTVPWTGICINGFGQSACPLQFANIVNLFPCPIAELCFLMESKHRKVHSIPICFINWRNGSRPARLVAFFKMKLALIFDRFVINFTFQVLLSLVVLFSQTQLFQRLEPFLCLNTRFYFRNSGIILYALRKIHRQNLHVSLWVIVNTILPFPTSIDCRRQWQILKRNCIINRKAR